MSMNPLDADRFVWRNLIWRNWRRGAVRSQGARLALGLALVATNIMVVQPALAQGLADFDYEDLTFRGVMFDMGYIYPTRVEPTATFGGRIDLGFLGPGVRFVVGLNHWSSYLKREEVGRLERRLETLISAQSGGPVQVDLGDISWSDVALSGDAHFLWRVPYGVLTYAGLGASTHILRGGGDAIDDTFVEDLLDAVRVGVNAHTGFEIPLNPRFRVVGEARYEVLENLRYLQFRVGGQFMLRGLVPGET